MSVQMTGLADYLPPNPGVVRMAQVDGRWEFEERDGRTSLSLELHIDPGGAVPGWLANRRIVGTPQRMLLNLEREFAAGCQSQ
jgi:hypothetical protein